MTYKELIENLSDEVRESRAWPDGTGRLSQQLRVCYGAILVIARELSLSLIPGGEEHEGQVDDTKVIHQTDLPEDIFFIRPDRGVLHFELDGERFSPKEAIPWTILRESSTNPFQSGNKLFNVDYDTRQVYFIGSDGCKVAYKPLFEAPDSDSYETLEVPLPHPYTEQAVQLVALHVEAIMTGNPQKSAVHQVLSELYGGASHD